MIRDTEPGFPTVRNFVISLITIFVSVGIAIAQCPEPSIGNSASVLKTVSASVTKPAEYSITFSAEVPGTSWVKPGAEAAVLSIFIDGRYVQDVVLFSGERSFEYRALIGKLEVGKHDISITLNSERSAKGARSVRIGRARLLDLSGSSGIDLLAIQNAPFLYARANIVDKFSDIPLVTYYEVLPMADGTTAIRYSTIFTNEDGGTQTAALMARWGRATDIEWVYEVRFRDGKRVSEIFQGANHVTTDFKGQRIFGEHPLLTTATDNNNFADSGCSKLRSALLPTRVDLTKRSRESVMDVNPWSYKIMADEALREGRVDPAKMGANTIDDLRNYVYVDVFTETIGAAVSVELTTRNGVTNRSDLNDERLRMARPGFQRIAVRIPTGATISSIKLVCRQISTSKTPGNCGRSEIGYFVSLDKNFSPRVIRPRSKIAGVLNPGEFLEWKDPKF